MQKEGYTFGHLSLIRNLALNILSGVATVRDRKSASEKKRDFWVFWKTPLFLGKWCGVATYFFLYKKKEKKLNTKYMTKLFFSYWLNKKEYIFDKLNITWLWVLVINYQIITWFFCPSYNLPKNKNKDKARSTYPKN